MDEGSPPSKPYVTGMVRIVGIPSGHPIVEEHAAQRTPPSCTPVSINVSNLPLGRPWAHPMTVVNVVDPDAQSVHSRFTVGMKITVNSVPESNTGGERRFSNPT